MDAGQRDLLEPGTDHPIDFAEDVVHWDAPWQPTRRRDDAVRARLRTAGLHTERVRRASGDARLDGGAARALAEPHHRDQSWLVVVLDDADDVWQRRELIRPARRIAAGDHNLRGRVVARDTTNRLARALVGRRCHRAGVDEHEIGGAWRRVGRSGRTQRFLEADGISLIDATTERDHRVLHDSNVSASL